MENVWKIKLNCLNNCKTVLATLNRKVSIMFCVKGRGFNKINAKTVVNIMKCLKEYAKECVPVNVNFMLNLSLFNISGNS